MLRLIGAEAGVVVLETKLLNLLRCAGCRSPRLADHGAELACAECSRAFPVLAGVPVMIPDATPERGPMLDPVVAAALMQRLGIAPGPVEMLRVRRASAARARARAGLSGLLQQDGAVLGTAPPDLPVVVGRRQVEWLGDYFPRAMPPCATLTANIRLRNAGKAVIPAAGEEDVTVAASWSDGDGAAAGEVRTQLPVDLAPGQVLTLPVTLQTPARPGRYTVSVHLVEEGLRWLDPAYGPVPVEVRDGSGFVPPAHWMLGPPQENRAPLLMRTWLAGLAVPRPHVLELGTGSCSLAAQAGYDVVTVDGDLLALQLGRLVPHPAALSVCADAADLPFAEPAFDAVLCVSALRTMADPARTLRTLRDHLRPGGFIGLFNEVAGHVLPGTDSAERLAELRRGLNPQQFSLSEIAGIVRSARLRIVALTVDGASLNARLEPEGDDA